MDEDRKGYATVGSDDNRDQLTMPIALREISNLSRVRKNRGGVHGRKRSRSQPIPTQTKKETKRTARVHTITPSSRK